MNLVFKNHLTDYIDFFLVMFFVNLTQTRFTWEEVASTEEFPLPDCLVDLCVEQFLINDWSARAKAWPVGWQCLLHKAEILTIHCEQPSKPLFLCGLCFSPWIQVSDLIKRSSPGFFRQQTVIYKIDKPFPSHDGFDQYFVTRAKIKRRVIHFSFFSSLIMSAKTVSNTLEEKKIGNLFSLLILLEMLRLLL